MSDTVISASPSIPPGVGASAGARAAACGVILAVAAVGYALARVAWEVGTGHDRAGGNLGAAAAVEDIVVATVALVGAAACAWLTLAAVAAAIAPRRLRGRIAALTPLVWRRVVGVGLGAAVTAGIATSASATPGWIVEPGPDDTSAAGWLNFDGPAIATDAPVAMAQSEAAETPPAATPLATPQPQGPATRSDRTAPSAPPGIPDQEYTVTRGDSLWTITAAQLDTDDAPTIAAALPALYEANRAVIGADPHLIVPGQVLALPEGWTR
ncbi:LysM peptidoglycan-binding domain-containing protein [Demequina sp. NBRC 110055]|uniref:LysM peptidoglycan-binding domain-containing protein n=1 Tax=Demequina sp. NBRC 110055 TaxID=1570344 RepID=UPI000A063DA3|nr:LysM peptidoglycan-binding domain-containing protein [Demequina sp. NBRC 110055]